ncbi:MAG: phage/plasmid primase, P4 family [Zestosphaera sp.]
MGQNPPAEDSQDTLETKNGIAVKSIVIKPIAVNKREAWFRVGDKLIRLRVSQKKGGDVRIAVIGNTVEAVYKQKGVLDCSKVSILVDDVDICHALSTIINNYDEFVEQYEERVRAISTRNVDYSTVPQLPREWEMLLYALTTKLLTRQIIKTFIIRSNDKEAELGIYCYDSGYYRECEESLKTELETMLEDDELLRVRLIPPLVGQILNRVRSMTKTEYKPLRRCLLFQNKVFCWDKFIQTGDIEAALIDPSPDLIVTHRIPWRLNTSLLKKRQGLLKFIPPESIDQLITLFRELAPKSFTAFYSWVKRPEDSENDTLRRVVLLLEGIGYTLYPHEYPLHRAFLLIGDGSNGKSTYLRLIESILSRENIASVNLTQLDPSVNRFAAADLYGKLANISSEPIRGVFDPTLFKQLTGEDAIRIERKFKDAFVAKNYAKMFFAANELPKITEDTYAFWRRWIVIEFPNRFNPDPEFFVKTFTQEEIEAIILLSLYAFRLVLKRKEFSETQTKQDVKTVWLSRSNPVYPVVRRMLDDGVIELRQDGYVIKTDLYALYKAYVELMVDEGDDVRVLAQKDFTIHLTRFFPVRAGTARIGGKQRHVYWGVAIKDYNKVKELIGQVETPQRLL